MKRTSSRHALLTRLSLIGLIGAATSACTSDDGPGSTAGSGAQSGASSTTGGSGGTSATGGSGGTDASGGASGNGSGGTSTMSGGSGGMSMMSGGGGGSGGGSGSGGGGGGSGSGQDSGMPDPTGSTCRALTPATDFGNACPASDPVTLRITMLRNNFSLPVFVTHAPGDDARLFVVERGGRIQVIERATGAPIGTFLDLTGRILAPANSDGGGEYGLLGLTFHPDYPEDPRIFVNYTAEPEASDQSSFQQTIVSSFEVSASDPDDADETTEQVLIQFPDPQPNHNGGMLAFGPDDCLYIGSGDGGGSNDTGTGHAAGGNGQSLATPLGKMLRVDVDDVSTPAPGNLAGAGYPHIWDYGLRNPWRFSFDRETGDLYIGDVGQAAREEINVAPPGTGNLNWGWPVMEGNICFGGGSCAMAGLALPADDYPQVGGDNCVIGGYVYRGSAIPSLRGWYLYADHGSRKIRAFVWDGEGQCDAEPLDLTVRDPMIQLASSITSFGEDANGELYITTRTGLFRIDAN